jgi:hypothetical protein
VTGHAIREAMPKADFQHLGWVAIIAFGAVFGLGELVRWSSLQIAGHGWLGFDATLVLNAGARLVAGTDPYADPIFLWAPPSLLAVAPFAILPAGVVIAASAAVKIAITVVAARWATRTRPMRDAILVLIGILTALPVLHDLALGNVMIPMTAAVALIAWTSDRWRAGIPLGILAAAVPKPFLLPVLVWMAIYRPRAAVGTLVAAGAVTLATGSLLGPPLYADWLHRLGEFGPLASTFPGNGGLSASAPALLLPASVLALAGLIVLIVTRAEPDMSLLYVLAVGIVAAPYASQLSAVPLLAASPVAIARLPRAALAFAAVMPLAVEWSLPAWAAGVALVAFWAALKARREGGHAAMSASADAFDHLSPPTSAPVPGGAAQTNRP